MEENINIQNALEKLKNMNWYIDNAEEEELINIVLQELDAKNKAMDLMADFIHNTIGCCMVEQEDFKSFKDCEIKCTVGIETECIKEYFEQKANGMEE